MEFLVHRPPKGRESFGRVDRMEAIKDYEAVPPI